MTDQWIDFKAVKEMVSLEAVLDHYNVALKRKGDTLTGKCPIHKGAHNSNAFHVSLEKNAWKCFGDCRSGGNQLDFVMRMENVDLRQAAQLLAEWFGLDLPERPAEPDRQRRDRPRGKHASHSAAKPSSTRRSPSTGGQQPVADHDAPAAASAPSPTTNGIGKEDESLPSPAAGGDIPTNRPLTFELRSLDPTHPYLAERGLTENTVRAFGLGFCSKGLLTGRIAIPIRDHLGQLVAYAGRAVDQVLADEDGKYKLPPDFKKSLVLYNLHRVADLARPCGLVVVEGFFSVFHLHQAGIPQVVALMGSSLSDEQEQLLLAAVGGASGRVSLMLDRDEAGRTATRELAQRLVTQTHVRIVPYECKQPDAIPPDELRRLFGA